MSILKYVNQYYYNDIIDMGGVYYGGRTKLLTSHEFAGQSSFCISLILHHSCIKHSSPCNLSLYDSSNLFVIPELTQWLPLLSHYPTTAVDFCCAPPTSQVSVREVGNGGSPPRMDIRNQE